MAKVHVYIARGNNCASADFESSADDPRADAKEQASRLWDEPASNLAAHPSHDCASRGCNG